MSSANFFNVSPDATSFMKLAENISALNLFLKGLHWTDKDGDLGTEQGGPGVRSSDSCPPLNFPIARIGDNTPTLLLGFPKLVYY